MPKISLWDFPTHELYEMNDKNKTKKAAQVLIDKITTTDPYVIFCFLDCKICYWCRARLKVINRQLQKPINCNLPPYNEVMSLSLVPVLKNSTIMQKPIRFTPTGSYETFQR